MLSAQCPNCGKTFKAPESFAGRSVRCRVCHTEFTIAASAPPPSTPPTEPPPTGPFIDPHPTPTDLTAAPSTPPTSPERLPPKVVSPFQPVGSVPKPGPELLPSEMFTADLRGPATTERTSHAEEALDAFYRQPAVRLAEHWALRLVIPLCLLWLAFSMHRVSPDTPGWLWISRTLWVAGLFSVLLMPMALLGLMVTCILTDRPMPAHAGRHVFVAFAPAAVFSMALWNAGGGTTPALLLGTILGLAFSAALLMVFLRLAPAETTPIVGGAVVGFLLGGTLVAALTLGINLAIVAGLKEANSSCGLTESPLLPWVRFDVPSDAVPAPAESTPPAPAPTPPTTPPPAASDDSPTPVPTLPPPPPPSVIPPVTTPPQNLMPVPQDTAPPATATPPITLPGHTEPLTRSPLVAAVSNIPTGDRFERILFTHAPSEWFAVVRRAAGRTRISVQRLGSPDPVHTAEFVDMAGDGGFALSPDGLRLARVAAFPRRGIQIWSFAQNRVETTLDLPAEPNEPPPVLVGFVTPNRIVYYTPGTTRLQWANLDRTETPRSIDLAHRLSPDQTAIAVSPTGQTAAVAFRNASAPTPTGRPPAATGHQLALVNLDTATRIRRIPIDRVRADFAVVPTGIAFSADARRFYLYYERADSAVLIAGTITPPQIGDLEAVYPDAPAKPPLERTFHGSALLPLPTADRFLIYGNGLADATGRNLGQIDIARVTAHQLAPDGSLLLVHEPEDGPRSLLRVQIADIPLDPPNRSGNTPPASPTPR